MGLNPPDMGTSKKMRALGRSTRRGESQRGDWPQLGALKWGWHPPNRGTFSQIWGLPRKREPWKRFSEGRISARRLRGNHWSNTAFLTHVFFKCDKYLGQMMVILDTINSAYNKWSRIRRVALDKSCHPRDWPQPDAPRSSYYMILDVWTHTYTCSFRCVCVWV